MPRYDDGMTTCRRRRRGRRRRRCPRSRRRPADDDDDLPRRRRARDDEDFAPGRPRKKSRLGLILGILGLAFLPLCGGGGFGVYYFFNSIIGEKREQERSANNLRQIGLALHNHHDVHGGLPTNTVGPNGQPLLSWRVHLLPYLGEQNLYSQFKLNEPWDSPNNRRLLDQMPRVYATPDEQRGSVPREQDLLPGFSNPGAVFGPRGGRLPGPPGMGSRSGPAGRRIRARRPARLAAAGRRAHLRQHHRRVIKHDRRGRGRRPGQWTNRRPTPPRQTVPKARRGPPKSDEILILLLDGSSRIIRRNTSETTLRAAVSANGGEIVMWD